MKILTQTLIAGSILLASSRIDAQESFAKAHTLFTQFWNDVLKTPNADVKTKELIRKRAVDLPALLEEPITQGILAYLNGTQHPSAEVLKNAIAKVLTAPMTGDQTAEGVADVLSTKANDAFLVVFSANFCVVCGKAWLGEFVRQNTEFVLQSSVENVATDQAVHLSLLPGGSPAPVVLLYGVHWGDAHNRLNVEAFSADGGLHLLWSSMNLPRGQIVLEGDHFTLTSDTALTQPFLERKETYQLVGSEFRLIQQSIQ